MHRIKEIVASQLRRQRVRTNQNLDKMANLKELCGNIPQSILHTATNYEVARRKVAAHRRQQREYNERMHALDLEQCIFEQCKRERTQKRVRNTFSRDEAGTCSLTTSTRRFATSQTFVEKRGKSVRTYTLTSYTNVVCKSYSNKY